ncbi:MAG: EamA family transporter [Verrucomicrobiales bacterium]|jgi:drug/metabolite transporter (DMT)-like permease|nr:EamA family transporter [Verrucomicrobiales bacterium]MDP6678225.1 DMT family transporter [Verrucomicrobiota bacterium]MDP6753441.1 DMT family transporter [Verrucomicrobiota bacterium]MDP7013213.1 DMT family transporter [Verrucomicrobiota bacterium]
MNREKFNSNLLLLTTSIIWGAGFVAQEMGSDHLGPNAFNAARYSIGTVCLLVILMVWHRGQLLEGFRSRDWVKASLSAGLFLFLGSLLQQAGISDEATGAGKTGFITGLYVVIVPALGLFVGHRTNFQTWAGVALATVGLWLLSFKQADAQWAIGQGDLLVFFGAFCWAGHVLVIDRFTNRVRSLHLAIGQVTVCAVASWVVAAFAEPMELANFQAAFLPALYLGVMSIAIAFTLQIIGQRKAHPTHASIIFAMEAVVGVFAGWLILSEKLTERELGGCLLMFCGMVLSQLPIRYFRLGLTRRANNGPPA